MVAEYQIDTERFNEVFPYEIRREVEKYVYQATKGIETGQWGDRYVAYWSIIGKAFNRHHQLPLGLPLLDDLFPPNIAVLDWLMGVDKSLSIADIGCGLGNLLPYLRELGFEKVCGYDTWIQIERWRAEQFLTAYGMEDCLVPYSILKKKHIDIITAISLPFRWIHADLYTLLAKAKYLLVDAGYMPDTPVEGYEEIGRYPNLLVVYQRVDNAQDSSR